MKRVLLTGGAGFVGSRVKLAHGGRWTIVEPPSGWLRSASEAEIRRFVSEARPDAILHTAAIADMGACDRDPEGSCRANVLLTLWLCRAARDCGAKFVAFSSDQVYNGRRDMGPFREEDDDLPPRNVYARHKIEAERRGLEILPEAVFLRATWMYDLPLYGAANKGNLLMELLRAAAAGEPRAYAANDFRGITYVRQVAELLAPALELPGGAYNFGSESALNMYDTACEFLRALGLERRIPDVLIRSEREEAASLRMDCAKLRRFGIEFDDTAQGIRRCARDYGLWP